MFYYKFYNQTVINEFEYFSENATLVASGEIPQVPMLLFTSNDKNKQEWPEYVERFASQVENVSIIPLDCPHYVHDYEYKRISDEVKNFLDGQ